MCLSRHLSSVLPIITTDIRSESCRTTDHLVHPRLAFPLPTYHLVLALVPIRISLLLHFVILFVLPSSTHVSLFLSFFEHRSELYSLTVFHHHLHLTIQSSARLCLPFSIHVTSLVRSQTVSSDCVRYMCIVSHSTHHIILCEACCLEPVVRQEGRGIRLCWQKGGSDLCLFTLMYVILV